MENKVILITGASSGIGKCAAEMLLKDGHCVYTTARSVDKMECLAEKGARVMYIDVTDEATINECVDTIIKEKGRIDVLVNNAGFALYGNHESVDMEDIKRQFDVNFFGMCRVNRAVLPHMRKRKSGKILMTASLVGRMTVPVLGWYCATKHAVKCVAETLRMEVSHLGIRVVMIEPGVTGTNLNDYAFEKYSKRDYPDDYKDLADAYGAYITNTYSKSYPVESAGRAIVKAINARKPWNLYKTTFDSHLYSNARACLPEWLSDKIILFLINRHRKK